MKYSLELYISCCHCFWSLQSGKGEIKRAKIDNGLKFTELSDLRAHHSIMLLRLSGKQHGLFKNVGTGALMSPTDEPL